MFRRSAVVLFFVCVALTLQAKEVFLPVTGEANGYLSEATIFNPSFTKDIVVNAQYLPADNIDHTNAASVPLTITKRAMRVFPDIVHTVFTSNVPLGAVRLTSNDDFVATQRIFQDARNSFQKGTLGVNAPGQELTGAKTKGVVLHLKSGNTTQGNFHSNIGIANPNTSVANLAFKLFGKNNALAGSTSLTLQPFSAFSPTNILALFGNPTVDLTDSWVSFTSDVPVFLYGSAVDEGSLDPTFVAAADDSGVPGEPEPDPQPQAKSVRVTAVDFDFSVVPSASLQRGDQVTFRISTSGAHGFRLFSPSGNVLINLDPIPAGITERTITLPESGSYVYVCTRTTCGAGHTDMVGNMAVP